MNPPNLTNTWMKCSYFGEVLKFKKKIMAFDILISSFLFVATVVIGALKCVTISNMPTTVQSDKGLPNHNLRTGERRIPVEPDKFTSYDSHENSSHLFTNGFKTSSGPAPLPLLLDQVKVHSGYNDTAPIISQFTQSQTSYITALFLKPTILNGSGTVRLNTVHSNSEHFSTSPSHRTIDTLKRSVTRIKVDNPVGGRVAHVEWINQDLQTAPLPHTTSSSWAPSSSTSAIRSLLHSWRCVNITDLAYREKLCPYPNPDAYLKSNKGQHSCEGRCGDVPEYRSVQPLCACDYKCIVHGDCCPDINTECPSIHIRGQSMLSRLNEASSSCLSTPFKVFSTCKALVKNNTTSRHSHSATSVPTDARTEANQYDLATLLGKKTTFNVADMDLGIIYQDYQTFSACKGLLSRAYFVPKEVTFACPKSYIQSELSIMFFKCRRLGESMVLTRFHRSCRSDTILSCNCLRGKYDDVLHNVCLGPSQPLSYYKIYESESVPAINLVQNCKVFNVTEATLVVDSKIKEGQIENDEITIKVRVIPTLSSHEHNTKRDLHSNKYAERNTTCTTQAEENSRFFNHSTVFNFDADNNVNKNDELADNGLNTYYKIELTHTAERSIHCPNLQTNVSDCTAVECSPVAVLAIYGVVSGEALLMQSSSESKRQKNLSCIAPSTISARDLGGRKRMSFCSCLRLQMVISKLQRPWAVVLKALNSSTCMMDVKLKYQENINEENLPEMFMFPEEQRPSPGPLISDGTWNSLNQELAAQLISRLSETPNYCSGESYLDNILVCFQSSQREGWIACIDLSSHRKTGLDTVSNSASQHDGALVLETNLLSILIERIFVIGLYVAVLI